MMAAGRFQDASAAAGEVLSVARGNSEAGQILQDAVARSRGHGADEARTQVGRARNAARSANAQRLASGEYATAVAAEREAQRLFDAGRLGEATIKFYEASGQYRRAEVAAQNETTRREAAARADSLPAEPARGLPPPPAASQQADNRDALRVPPATQPSAEAAAPAPTPAPPTTPTTTVAPTTTVPAAPVAPPPPSAEAVAAARDAAITDLLARYKAAVEGRSLDAVKRIWPGISGREQEALRDEFRLASSITVNILNPRITATTDTATVTFIRDYVVVKEGQQLHSQSDATMDVRRNGASWVIDRIRFAVRR
jgi:hypothetical protein